MVASALLEGLGLGGCRRPKPGTCRRDIDCAPGFDCKAGRCEARVRWVPGASSRGQREQGARAGREEAATQAPSPGQAGAATSGAVAPSPTLAPRPAWMRTDAGASAVQEKSAPIVLPPSATEPAAGRVPLWQQRRKQY